MIKTHQISLGHYIKRSHDALVSDMNGEKVMLSIKNGNYYNLGLMGSHIWNLIEEPLPIIELLATLLSEFEVDKKTCEQDVLNFLEKMAEEELICIYDKQP